MNQQFYDAMEESPVIAAVKDFEGLEKCCRIEEIRVVFILFGDVCNIDEIVRKVREKGKIAMVHIDLISGLGSKRDCSGFYKKSIQRQMELFLQSHCWLRGQRNWVIYHITLFIIDSMAFEKYKQTMPSGKKLIL